MISFCLLDSVVVVPPPPPPRQARNRGGSRSQEEFQMSLVSALHYFWENTGFLRLLLLGIMCSELRLGGFLATHP